MEILAEKVLCLVPQVFFRGWSRLEKQMLHQDPGLGVTFNYVLYLGRGGVKETLHADRGTDGIVCPMRGAKHETDP